MSCIVVGDAVSLKPKLLCIALLDDLNASLECELCDALGVPNSHNTWTENSQQCNITFATRNSIPTPAFYGILGPHFTRANSTSMNSTFRLC